MLQQRLWLTGVSMLLEFLAIVKRPKVPRAIGPQGQGVLSGGRGQLLFWLLKAAQGGDGVLACRQEGPVDKRPGD